VVVARVEWGVTAERERGGDGGTRLGGTQPGSARKGAEGGAREGASPDSSGVPGGRVAQSLLEEILVDPAVAGPDSADRK
ncbi:hypothetical protein ACWGK9_36525, partial [Streptomyces rubiginosohelvolus]